MADGGDLHDSCISKMVQEQSCGPTGERDDADEYAVTDDSENEEPVRVTAARRPSLQRTAVEGGPSEKRSDQTPPFPLQRRPPLPSFKQLLQANAAKE